MKKCDMCNIEYEEGKYCEKCGSDLEEIVEKVEEKMTEKTPLASNEMTEEVSEDSTQDDKESAPSNSNEIEEVTEEVSQDDKVSDVTVNETNDSTDSEEKQRDFSTTPSAPLEMTEEASSASNKMTEDTAEKAPVVSEEVTKELTPKEAKQKAKEDAKKAKEEAKKAKEEAKKQKQEEKAAKAQAKLDKKQAQIDAKIKKQEEKEAKAKAKAEKKAAKAEKKANRKFKKTRRVLWILLFVIILIIALFAWYLGHSQIDNTFEKGNTSINTVLELIANDDDMDGKVKVDYDIFNNVINETVDFKELDVISMATIENGYFSKVDKKFVLTLHSTLGRTSLLLDADTEIDEGKVNMTLDNARLGNLHLIVPSSMVELPIEQSFDLPQFVWLEIDDVDLKKDNVALEYKLNVKKINNDFKALNIDVEPELLTYLKGAGINLPAADIIFKAVKDEDYSYTEEDVYAILQAFVEDGEDITNWVIVVPENLEDDFIAISNIIVGKEKTEENLKKAKKEQKKILKDFDTFVNNEKESALRDASIVAFENIEAYHTNAGFPAYYYGDKGKVFSQTLHEFIDLEDIAEELPNVKNYKLYANGNKAILATEVGKDVWYIKQGSDKIKKESKKKFLKAINYDEEKEYTAEIPQYGIDVISPFANAVIKKEAYTNNDDLEIKYLAYDDKYGIMIACLHNEPEIAPKYYLLANNSNEWKVIDIFDDTENLGKELLEEISSGEVSPQLLPRYEMQDFERGFLKTADRKAIKKLLNENEKITYYTMINDNIYIITEDENADVTRYIMPNGVDGEMIEINERKGVEAYIKDLSGSKEYDNYKPEFMFNQVASFFNE